MNVQPIRTYRAAPGAPYNHDQAQEIGTHLEKQKNWPGLTTDQVVDAGRPNDSPLHPFFEWNDDKAAEKYRKVQARTIINHLVIMDSGEPQKAFHSVSPPEPGEHRQYLHFDSVRTSPEDASEVLANAMGELEGWLDRYNRYSRQFGNLFGAVESAFLEYSRRESA